MPLPASTSFPHRHEASTSTSTTRHPNDLTDPDSDLQVLSTSTRGAGNTARSLLKQEILSEEEYIAHLSYIIKRDFFPSLANLDAQHEILHAFESEDPKQVQDSIRRMRTLWTSTPANTTAEVGPATSARTWTTPYDDDSTPTYFGQTPLPTTTPSSSTTTRRARASPPQPPPIDPASINLSLDSFQSRYTSEDNSSFAVLLARDNAARKQKYAWAWEAEKKAKVLALRGREARQRLVDVTRDLIERSEDGSVSMLDGGAGRPGERKLIVGKETKIGRDDRLMIASSGSGVATSSNQARLIQDTPESRPRVGELELIKRGSHKLALQGPDPKDQGLQYVDYDSTTVEEDESNRAPTIDQVQPRMESWDFSNRNSFMFPPDANSDAPSHPSLANADKGNGRLIKAGEEKAVNYAATRLTTFERTRLGEGEEDDAMTTSSGPSRSRIGAAIAGTPRTPPSRNSFISPVVDHNTEPKIYLTADYTNPSRTPKVSGFSFVDALPSPQAAKLPPQALQELMTWGTIEATPVTLRSSTEYDGSVGPFKIREDSRREGLALRMATQAKRSLSDRVDAVSNGRGKRPGGLGSLRGVRGGSILSPSGSSSTSRTQVPHTPRLNSTLSLSPAAASILHRTKQGRSLGKGMTRTMSPLHPTTTSSTTSSSSSLTKGNSTMDRLMLKRLKAKVEAREKESKRRLERERWSASPAPVPGPAPVPASAPGGEEEQEAH